MEWDLSLIYKSDEDALKDSEEAVKEAEGFLERVGDLGDPEKLKRVLESFERMSTKVLLPLQYASLKVSKNTQDVEAQKLYGIIQKRALELEKIFQSLKARLASLPESTLEGLRGVENYSHFIEKVIKERKHLLSEEAEKALAALGVSRRDAAADLYEKITSSYVFEIDGRKMTAEEVRALRHTRNGNLRKRAMRIFFERYRKDKLVIEGLYNVVIKDWDTEAELRRYERPISMRNLQNEVSDDVVDKLIDITSSRTDMVKKYYGWKSKVLGEVITPADIYAPISEEEEKLDFEEAKRIVLESYYSFSEEIGKIVESFFEERRIDAFPKEGKRGGAFCSYYVPNGKPYVLLNYTGKLRDVMTLAHELGHGVHGTLSSKQTLLNYHTPLTMAEVASVFGEFLVFDRIKEQLSGEKRRAFIAAKVEDTFATMFRQNMFVRFEIRAHDLVKKEGFASFDDLSEIYSEELKGMFKGAVKITKEYHDEWSSIPHFFFAPFYVYAYNFANALVIALYKIYLDTGKSFVPKYIELLESGGKDSPEKLLGSFGVDLKDEKFWNGAFDYLESLVEEVIS